MSSLDRFCNREYYETKFMEDGTVLWLWETGQNIPQPIYGWEDGRLILVGYRNYTNNQFIPAQLYTLDSTPNYFLTDLYGISSGGYSAYRSDKHHHGFNTHYDDHYFGGGSGACVYLANVKIRLRDEDLKPIVYNVTGKAGPIDYGGDYRWEMYPTLQNNRLDDWKITLAEPYRTPNGIAPAGTTIIAMSSGGNASCSFYSVGNGAALVYVPTQSGFPVSISTLPKYAKGLSLRTNQWFNYNGTAYVATSDFVATNWEIDKLQSKAAPNYDPNVTFNAGTYLYWNGQLYRVDKTFQGDEGNTLLGFADYFLNKDSLTSDFRRVGRQGGYALDGPHWAPGGKCDRVFGEGYINPANEIWVSKSLAWGNGQDNARRGTNGQGGGLVVIYHGETN